MLLEGNPDPAVSTFGLRITVQYLQECKQRLGNRNAWATASSPDISPTIRFLRTACCPLLSWLKVPGRTHWGAEPSEPPGETRSTPAAKPKSRSQRVDPFTSDHFLTSDTSVTTTALKVSWRRILPQLAHWPRTEEDKPQFSASSQDAGRACAFSAVLLVDFSGSCQIGKGSRLLEKLLGFARSGLTRWLPLNLP